MATPEQNQEVQVKATIQEAEIEKKVLSNEDEEYKKQLEIEKRESEEELHNLLKNESFSSEEISDIIQTINFKFGRYWFNHPVNILTAFETLTQSRNLTIEEVYEEIKILEKQADVFEANYKLWSQNNTNPQLNHVYILRAACKPQKSLLFLKQLAVKNLLSIVREELEFEHYMMHKQWSSSPTPNCHLCAELK